MCAARSATSSRSLATRELRRSSSRCCRIERKVADRANARSRGSAGREAGRAAAVRPGGIAAATALLLLAACTASQGAQHQRLTVWPRSGRSSRSADSTRRLQPRPREPTETRKPSISWGAWQGRRDSPVPTPVPVRPRRQGSPSSPKRARPSPSTSARSKCGRTTRTRTSPRRSCSRPSSARDRGGRPPRRRQPRAAELRAGQPGGPAGWTHWRPYRVRNPCGRMAEADGGFQELVRRRRRTRICSFVRRLPRGYRAEPEARSPSTLRPSSGDRTTPRPASRWRTSTSQP